MKYIKANSHKEYIESQTLTNKRKLCHVWVTDNEIDEICNWISKCGIIVNKGICHGVRNGYEVAEFRKKLNADIIGTEISDTATNYDDVIQWDFHDENTEWKDAFNFIYSNSIDHSYDFDLALTTWMDTLDKENGRCFIEWNSDMKAPHNISDCFGTEKDELIKFISSRYTIETTFPVKGSHNRTIIVIKHNEN